MIPVAFSLEHLVPKHVTAPITSPKGGRCPKYDQFFTSISGFSALLVFLGFGGPTDAVLLHTKFYLLDLIVHDPYTYYQNVYFTSFSYNYQTPVTTIHFHNFN